MKITVTKDEMLGFKGFIDMIQEAIGEETINFPGKIRIDEKAYRVRASLTGMSIEFKEAYVIDLFLFMKGHGVGYAKLLFELQKLMKQDSDAYREFLAKWHIGTVGDVTSPDNNVVNMSEFREEAATTVINDVITSNDIEITLEHNDEPNESTEAFDGRTQRMPKDWATIDAETAKIKHERKRSFLSKLFK